MADRRMFHKNIVESDYFLEMPISAQALYFHIGMHADDDGFVNGPKRIARLVGASDADLQTLINNRFLLKFDNGVVVIKHWRIANSLKNDRAKLPQYPELADRIYIKENRSYTDRPAEGAISLLRYKQNYLDSKRIPNGFQMDSQGKGRERSIGELSITEVEGDGIRGEGGFSTDFSTDDIAAATTDKQLKIMNGELGKGVVILSNAQTEDLLEKLGLDMFDYYVDKLATFIIKKGAKVKNHYETILNWYMQDSAIQ